VFALGAGCNAILGIDEATVTGPVAPGGASGAAGAGSGDGGSAGAGSGGATQGSGGVAGSAAFSVSLDPAAARVVRGGSFSLVVNVARVGGFSGAVELSLSELPAGVSAMPATVAEGATSGSVELSASALAALGNLGATLRANATGQTERTLPVPLLVADRPGVLDQSFGGGDGIATVGEAAVAKAVAIQADGKIVVGGVEGASWFLARHLPDGAPDPDFGTAGLVIEAAGVLEGLALQPDGRIVAVGEMGGKLALVRFNANGSRDQAFGSSGLATTTPGSLDESHGYGLVVQSTGELVITATRPTPGDSFLLRFSPEGDLDVGFGDSISGIATGVGLEFPGLAIDANGRLLLGGTSRVTVPQFTALRFDKNNVVDPSFGQGAGALLEPNPYVATGLALGPDGGLVLSGYALDGVEGYAFGRFDAEGVPDKGFGVDGVVRVEPVDLQYSRCRGLFVQPDGKIVGVTTGGTPASGLRATIVRHEADGGPDKTFGVEGRLVLDDGTIGNALFAVTRQPDGRVVAVGSRAGAGFMIVRAWD
jgi:uncharacterized delta-60 repeat protein